MRPAALILSAGLALVAHAQVYWWRYPNTDAENLDIEQAPCKASCTLEQLEGYCSALPNCVAVSCCSGDRRACNSATPFASSLPVQHARLAQVLHCRHGTRLVRSVREEERSATDAVPVPVAATAS